jgi:hypothetical protein
MIPATVGPSDCLPCRRGQSRRDRIFLLASYAPRLLERPPQEEQPQTGSWSTRQWGPRGSRTCQEVIRFVIDGKRDRESGPPRPAMSLFKREKPSSYDINSIAHHARSHNQPSVAITMAERKVNLRKRPAGRLRVAGKLLDDRLWSIADIWILV